MTMTTTTAVIPMVLPSSSLATLLAPLAILAVTSVLVTLLVLIVGLVTEHSDAVAVEDIRRRSDDAVTFVQHAA
jgi:hypothetical protein